MQQQSLFQHITARQFPPQRRRPGRPPREEDRTRRWLLRYGPSNPDVFTVALREDLTPAPYTPRRALMALRDKDAFGEWADAEHEQHAPVLRELLGLPNDYDASVAHVRAGRPTVASEALRWWNLPRSRAHFLNALLCRGARPLAQVQRDMNVHHDRMYEYLPRWGMTWQRMDGQVQVADAAGETYDARLVRVVDGPQAELRLDGYTMTVAGRFDARSRVFRVTETLGVGELLPVPVAAQLAGLTVATARSVLPITTLSSPARMPLVSVADLARTVPEQQWRGDVPGALRDHNPCRCAFWDHHQGACGLGRDRLPAPGTAAYACEDHATDA